MPNLCMKIYKKISSELSDDILTLLDVMCFVFFPTSSKYIWLKTTTDCTDNPKFEEVSKTKAILSYRIND